VNHSRINRTEKGQKIRFRLENSWKNLQLRNRQLNSKNVGGNENKFTGIVPE
jgi:hypothetical protein